MFLMRRYTRLLITRKMQCPQHSGGCGSFFRRRAVARDLIHPC